MAGNQYMIFICHNSYSLAGKKKEKSEAPIQNKKFYLSFIKKYVFEQNFNLNYFLRENIFSNFKVLKTF